MRTLYTCENRMVETKFEINKEKRTVVCIITAINDIPNRLEKYNLADSEYDDIALDVRIYKGIAKCAPEDEWDEKYGKRLAEYRASRERQVDVNNELRSYYLQVTKNLDKLATFGLMRDPHKPRLEEE